MSETPVIGHRRLLGTLDTLSTRGKLPAALLLVGPDGIGKRTVAERLGAQLLSVEPAAFSHHPDVLRPALQQSDRLRDALVELLGHAHARPVLAPFRILLLENIDQLSLASQPLLLKTIEDASPTTRLFFTAQYRTRVLPTIRSRTLLRTLSPVPDRELQDGLRSLGYETAHIEAILPLVGGRPGLALRLLQDSVVRDTYLMWNRLHTEGALPTLSEASEAEAFLTFLSSRARVSSNAPALRRLIASLAMLRQHVPLEVVLEYAGATPRA